MMDFIEQVVVIQCVRESYKSLGFSTHQAVVSALKKQNENIDNDLALSILQGQKRNTAMRATVASEALKLLRSRPDSVEEIVQRCAPGAGPGRGYLKALLQPERYKLELTEIDQKKLAANASSAQSQKPPKNLDVIFGRWLNPFRKGNRSLESGIYQIYRRYKPDVTSYKHTKKGTLDLQDPLNHNIVCELVCVDSESMQTMLITCDLKRYHGALYTNNSDILFSILQRVNERKGVHQRFMSLKLEPRLPFYSGICTQVGNTTFRPVASECIFVPIDRAEHQALYAEIDALLKTPWTGEFEPNIAETSTIADYISANPPKSPPYEPNSKAWQRVKFVRDIPFLRDLVRENEFGKEYFREPSRTLSAQDIMHITHDLQIVVFRHSARLVENRFIDGEG